VHQETEEYYPFEVNYDPQGNITSVFEKGTYSQSGDFRKSVYTKKEVWYSPNKIRTETYGVAGTGIEHLETTVQENNILYITPQAARKEQSDILIKQTEFNKSLVENPIQSIGREIPLEDRWLHTMN